MARKFNPSKFKSDMRRIQQRQRQAVNKYNAAIRKYNREVRVHNTRVRANREKLRREIARLNSRPTSIRYVTYRTSTQMLHESFTRVERVSEQGRWTASDELFEMAEGEAANSVAVLNTLLDPTPEGAIDVAVLQQTRITNELRDIDADLDKRWRGALFSLNPLNPDAARHFCTSSREILVKILDENAPEEDVKEWDPKIELNEHGRVKRRDKIRYCLAQTEQDIDELVDFVDDDINNVMDVFSDFNPATHGAAGKYDLTELDAIKTRVEGAFLFLNRIVTFDA